MARLTERDDHDDMAAAASKLMTGTGPPERIRSMRKRWCANRWSSPSAAAPEEKKEDLKPGFWHLRGMLPCWRANEGGHLRLQRATAAPASLETGDNLSVDHCQHAPGSIPSWASFAANLAAGSVVGLYQGLLCLPVGRKAVRDPSTYISTLLASLTVFARYGE